MSNVRASDQTSGAFMALNGQMSGSDGSPRYAGAIDCDLHCVVPDMSVLLCRATERPWMMALAKKLYP
jgi:hypothetical protein